MTSSTGATLRLVKFSAIGLLVAGTGLQAQDQPSIYDRCAAIEDDVARLSCFDATYDNERKTRIAVAERERERRADEFGLSAVQIEERDEARREARPGSDVQRSAMVEEKDEITSAVVEVFVDAARRSVILLENGQVWRATSNRTFRGAPRDGWRATVKKNWSGGYRMTFDERSGFLGVSRVR